MNAPPESVWQALRGLNAQQRHAFIASYLGWTLDAFDFFVLVMVLRHVAADFHVTKEAVTYAIFLTLAMRPAGALVFGLLADRYGRRPTLMFNVAFFSLMELLSGFAPTMGWLLVLRALYGFGMGGEWGVGASLVMETVPTRTRGVLSGILQQGYPVGYLLAALTYNCIFPYLGWRWMFFAGSIPALLVLYIRSSVQESPAWLQAHAARGGAARTGRGAHEIWQAVRTHGGLFFYLVLLMTAFNCFSHGTQDLYPSVLLEGQRKLPPRTVGNIVIIYNLGALGGGIFFGACSQFLGRRRTMMAAALLALPLIPAWAFAQTPGVVAVGAFFLQFMVQGAWGVVPAHLNELAPAAVRGTFPGLAYQLGNLLAAGTSTLEAAIAARHGQDYGWAMAVVVAIVAVAVAALAYAGPEAKNADFLAGIQPAEQDAA
jgi:SHS family lactate transporter-like MFS transporter